MRSADESADRENALADFAEAIRLDPNCAQAYYERGRLRSLKGQVDQALHDYAAAIERGFRTHEVLSERAAAWQKSGDLDRALEDLNEAIRLREPEYERVRGDAGLFEALEADRDDARTEDVCVELEEIWTPAKIFERRERRFGSGCRTAEDAYDSLRHEAAERYCRRAEILKQKGQREGVLRDATAALQFAPYGKGQALRAWALATADDE